MDDLEFHEKVRLDSRVWQEELTVLMRGVVSLSLLLGAPFVATAQQTSNLRVTTSAVVLEEPMGDAAVVSTVSPGEVLEVLDERGDWFMVRPPGGLGSWRTGWIGRSLVEPISDQPPRGAQQLPPPQPWGDRYSQSAERKGFIVGIGGGVGFPRVGFDFNSGSNFSFTGDPSVVTDFKIGYAASDQLLLYYRNIATFANDFPKSVLTLSGFGTKYMFSPTSPSGYVNGAVGVAAGGYIDFGEGTFSNLDSGVGFSLGGGWEFARHFSIGGDIVILNLDSLTGFGSDTYTVYTATFSYLFY